METKTFELRITPKFYWLLITMLPVFLFSVLLGLKLDEYLRQNTALNVWIIFLIFGLFIFINFKILAYFIYANCLITANPERLSINITKAGIGIKKEEIQYNWDDLISFQKLVGKQGNSSLLLIFDDKNVIYFKNNDAFYAYLKTNFPEKEGNK
jgi:predicted membrane protein